MTTKYRVILFLGIFAVFSYASIVFAEININNQNGSEVTLPLELSTSNNTKLGYSFDYPSTWRKYEALDGFYTRVETLQTKPKSLFTREEKAEYFKIEVVVLPADNKTLDKWVSRQNKTSYPLPKILEQEKIEVSGYPAIYQVEQFGEHIHSVVYALKDDQIYVLNNSSLDDKYKKFSEDFIKSFKFN